MGVRENKIETYLNEEIEKIGGITRKWVCPGRNGVPDRIVIINEIVWFVETKTPDGILSPAQIREQNRLLKLSMHVSNLYSKKDIDYFIELLKILSK